MHTHIVIHDLITSPEVIPQSEMSYKLMSDSQGVIYLSLLESLDVKLTKTRK